MNIQKVLFLAIFPLFLGGLTLKGQNQEGSVEIAKSVAPTATLVDAPVNCLEAAAKILAPKEAAKFCLDAAKIEAERAKKVANEAADATKASRPIVISPYGYYGRYGRSSYYGGTLGIGYRYSQRRIIQRHVVRERRAPVVRERTPRERRQRNSR